MSSSKNGVLVCVFVELLFRCLLAQNCDFSSCSWTVRQGLIQTNYTDLQKVVSDSRDIQDLHNKTDRFGYCSKLNGSKCRIRSPWLIPDPNSHTVCLFFDVFAGLNQGDKSSQSLDNAVVKGLLKISVTTADGEDDQKLQNISHLHQNRWDTLSTKFNFLDEKFRIVIDITLEDDGNYLALDNIVLVTNCADDVNYSQVNKTHRCTTPDSFMCDDLHCVRPDKLCNLQHECDNGKDETDALCAQLPYGMMCNFENGSCGWQVFTYKAQLNWTRHHGPTPTGGTGPSFDHTYGNSSGYYMYLESGDGNFHDSAVLTSRVFDNTNVLPDCKLRFFYHMYGRRVGSLEVQILNWCNMAQMPLPPPLTLWVQQDDQGNKWVYQEVSLNTDFKRFTIQFRVTKVFMDHGDIAIDDVTFSPACYGYRYTKNGLKRQPRTQNPVPLRLFLRQRKAICSQPPQQSDMTSANPDIDVTGNDADNSTFATNAPDAIYSPDMSTSENASSSTNPIQVLQESKLQIAYIIIIVIAAIIVSVVMGTTILCLALRNKKDGSVPAGHLEIMTDNPEDSRLAVPVQPSSFDMQLRCTVTELNPNYDFINAKYPEHQLREIPRNKLKLTRLIGQGAFGEVYEGTLKNLCANVDQLQVAVKTLPALCSEQAETDFTMEAVIISKFMHKNVVKCLGVCFEDHPRYIILELLQGGDLRSFLRDSRPKDQDAMCVLNMEDLVKLSLDVANGCRHLEEKRFIHRDIAARNCLLTSRGQERIAKIADFGMSRDIYSADYYRKGGKTMLPIKWMPPEAFLDGVFTTKTDVWSFGILLWEIFTLGYMPYPGQTNTDVMHFVASGGRLDPPDNCPARLNKIMIMCWNSVADIRPSFSEIIEHLDMCLQDPEVMNADLSLCHLQIGEYFKDAATLAKTDAPSSAENTIPSPSIDMEDVTAEFRGHVESQSTEPLLQT